MTEQRAVVLSRGKLILRLEAVDLFGLTRYERNFVAGLLDLLDALEDASQDERFRHATRREMEQEGEDAQG